MESEKKIDWLAACAASREVNSVIHINDCKDENARLRLSARSGELIGDTAAFAGAESDLSASGLLIDALAALDAYADGQRGERKHAILVNVAPRSGAAKKYENGTPFCYFWVGKVLVFSTFDGLTLSLVKKFALTDSVRVLDTHEALRVMRAGGLIDEQTEEYVAGTQFRSMEFSPRAAAFLMHAGELPGEDVSISEIADAPRAVWFVDNFGNCKTTLTEAELHGDIAVNVGGQTLPHTARLKDLPDGEAGLVTGSSGLSQNHFLEIMMQGNSAAAHFKLAIGDLL
jgi:hypothetical protein